MRAFAGAAILVGLLAGAAAAQTQTSVQDIYIVKVKPEKRGDFDAIARRIADANRKAKGDVWVAYSVEYGEQNTVMMSSVRENLAAVDTGMSKFEAAMKEGFGPTFMKLFQDMSNTMTSSRSEIRRRRMDLSRSIPDQDGIYKMVGNSRYMRQNVVRVRPGHNQEFEAALKDLKAALEQGTDNRPTFVSQSWMGAPSGTYYISTYGKNMADFAPPNRQLADVMGAEGAAKYMKAWTDGVMSSEQTVARMVPDISNVPEGIANVDPAFWRPVRKMPAAPAAKPAAAAAKSGD